ncbi:uncharacterized protein MONOS_14940 [Monocercomonoides exilis]|uniref:uncharacterized protein n=1 Tax=Monocercomonoides exilis TaxID=2049356 RepID=UPI003559BB59|nr:hypothetical protein MONOS_14940 [Monocercomonoides exilis]|eukprot:MONOS_14940.1-p1 / transcript=MONOS_14940.1 / gene=MONOS_14940 / organism=Monocercomonoides_exilis_PA203 / gene_product=unspecified product / transcript_product=unspecified product / location=Mono_scaffold01111:94-2800(-) / protein_length=804 / sequence_SO=supercontig / SO=protein_coding / is_pseudo=false
MSASQFPPIVGLTPALQEARTVRIQGRFGFRAATAMSTDASSGILTERQELILKETRQEAKLERGFQRPALPITRVQASPPQEDSNSEEGGTRAVGAGDQGCVNNFRSSSQGNRAEEAHWRENRFVTLSMEANRRREIDKQWSAGYVEKQAVQESSQQSPVQRWSVSSQPIKDRGIQENIRRTVTNRSCYPNEAEGGQTQKQCISHSKEVRQLETDSRLSETKRSSEENTFQVRRRKNSRTTNKTERLRSIPRLGTSLLFNSSFKRTNSLSCFQIHGKRLLLQKHAFRLCGCTAPVHTHNEEGDSGDKKKMGCQSRCLFGRSSFSASRSRSLEENNSGNHLVSRKPWPSDKQKEMQPHAEFAVQLPWIRMEYNQLRCVSNGGKKKGSARAVSQVGEKVFKSQDRQSEGFRIIRGKAKCNALRSFRRIFTFPIHLQIVAERSYDRRIGWNDEAECVNPPADKKMEMDVDEEPQTQTNSSVYSRSSANHRCIRKLLGSNPQTKQNVTRLSQSFSIRCEKPIIQLQRTKSCGTCPNTFCTNPSRESDFTVATSFRQLSSCFQREQMECRKESPSNTQKDMDIEGETEDSPESSSSPRIAKHKSRCFVPPGKSRRLQHCRQRAQRNLVCSSSYSNAGRLCSSAQPQGRSLVRNWKPIGRRRSSISMEERVRSGTPPSSPDSNDDSEGTEGESTSSITPAELEGAELGCAIGEDASSDIRMEESENSTEKGSINGKHRCMSSSRQVKSHIDQSTELKARAGGEGLWKKDLSHFHWQRSAYRELLSRRGMDIYSASHTLENSGKRVIWA